MSSSDHGALCMCREHPLPTSLSVQAGRDAYLAENGFTMDGYESEWTSASFFGLPLPIPNTPIHRWAIKLHDLHHVATGFGTDMVGEGEISAWEARRGLRPLGLYVGTIVFNLAAFGLVIAPRRTRAAWRKSGETRSLFHPETDYDALLAMTIGELRALLDVPPEGLGTTRKLHPDAPK